MLGYSTDICRGRWVALLPVFFLFSKAVLRIRDVYPGSDFFPTRIKSSIADPGCLSRIRLFSIPDPGSQIRIFPSGSRIRIKELKYFNQKKWFLCSRKYDTGCSSRIPDPDPYFLPIPDPEVKKAPDPGSQIRIRNTVQKAMRWWRKITSVGLLPRYQRNFLIGYSI
jgi:hypothetical protein